MKDLIVLSTYIFLIKLIYAESNSIALIISMIILVTYTLKYFRLQVKIEKLSEHQELVLKKQRANFINFLTHEIKIPTLAQIRGMELLKNETIGTLNEEQKDFVNQIIISGNVVLNMISDVITALNLDNKTYKLVYERFNMSELIYECFKLLSDYAKNKNITFVCISNIEYGNCYVEADKTELERALINLLTYAIDCSLVNNRIEVVFETNKDSIHCSIQGQNFVKRINSQYAKVGTKLNLYLSKKIIEYHSGNLESPQDEKHINSFTIPKYKKELSLNTL